MARAAIHDPVSRSLTIAPLIDWGAAAHARSGESESGDAYLIKRVPRGILIGIADGLGYGAQAAEAARAALALVESHASDSLTALVERCHRALRKMRGAAMTLASIDGSTDSLTWLGIGSVTGVLLQSGHVPDVHEPLILCGGVVGQRIPRVIARTRHLSPGDTLVFMTNGVQWIPGDASIPRDTPDVMARRLLLEHSTTTDDALVVVARYRGLHSVGPST